jgi:hypothetical protein
MPSRRVAAVVLLVCACVVASAAMALATTLPVKESPAAFEAQLRARQVQHAATLRTKTHLLHATLVNGSKVAIAVSSQSQQRLLNEARADGVTVKVAHVKALSHKRRYIAGAAVIILILLAAVGLLLRRRRRTREEELGPRAAFPVR